MSVCGENFYCCTTLLVDIYARLFLLLQLCDVARQCHRLVKEMEIRDKEKVLALFTT